MRGKCRYCDHSLSQTGGLWVSEVEVAWPELCRAAPPRPCPVCGGVGEVFDQKTRKDVPCLFCRGRGVVLGFHWPWRQPAPPM